MEATLALESVSVSYSRGRDRVLAASGASIELPSGAIRALIGESGCGKTSLLRAAAGLLAPSSGRVLIGGRELSGPRPGTAVILQDSGLLPWKTVSANVELPLLLGGSQARERRRASEALLEETGLAGLGRRFPAELSGGMRQRVALARALAGEPDLLLLDEPFSSLDALTREDMQELLLAAQRRRGAAVLLVTHSIEEAVYLADAVYLMAGREPGRVTACLETGSGQERGPSYRRTPRFHELSDLLRRELEAARLAAGPGAGAA